MQGGYKLMEREKKKKEFVHGEAYKFGIAMENENAISISVRKKDGSIEDKVIEKSSNFRKNKLIKTPVIRGLIRFVEGSINQFLGESYASKLYNEKSVIANNREKKIRLYLSFIGIILIGFLLYFFMPTLIMYLLKDDLKNIIALNLFEIILRIVIFLTVFITFSKTKNAKLSAQYHGAEHKVLFCHLSGEKISIENAKKYSIYNPSCGSSLLILLILFSIPVFIWINYENLWLRTIIMLLLVPLVIGFSFDLLTWAESSKSKIAKIIRLPGIFLQRFNTKEPDEEHLEVAVNAINKLLYLKN
jgi:uncharacterized protein YqhQ